MKSLAEQMRNHDREQMSRMAHNLPEQYQERAPVEQVAQVFNKLFNELRRGDDARTDFYQRILEVQAFLSGKQGDSPAVGFAPSHAAKPRN